MAVEQDGLSYLKYGVDSGLRYVLIFNLIYLIFISVHMYFTNYYTQSASIVYWYFVPANEGGCGCTCLASFILAATKSLGTICLSALVMTPLYIMIVFCEYLDQKRSLGDSAISAPVKCLIKCAKCCLWCFEKLLRYINRALLTFSQIYNQNWWRSAKLTLEVLLSDPVLIAVMNGIAAFIVFLSKIVVAVLNTFLFVLYLVFILEKEMSGWILPAFVVFFLSFLVSSFVLSMLTNVIDIVFVCFVSDEDLTPPGQKPFRDSESGIDDMVTQLKETQSSSKVGSDGRNITDM
jgi:hypothetical protein